MTQKAAIGSGPLILSDMAMLNVSAQERLPGNAWLACNMQQAAYGAGKSAVSSMLLLCCCMHSVGPFAPDVVIDCWSEIGVHRPAESVAQAVSRAVVIGQRATIELGFCLFCQKARSEERRVGKEAEGR